MKPIQNMALDKDTHQIQMKLGLMNSNNNKEWRSGHKYQHLHMNENRKLQFRWYGEC